LDKLSLQGRRVTTESKLTGTLSFRKNPDFPRRYIVEVECAVDDYFSLEKSFFL
jgi:hypothetical protein